MYPCNFVVNNQTYSCAEQFFMYQKAVLFRDSKLAKEIMNERNPFTIKRLGRNVRNFDNNIWKTKRERIVKIGNYAKFKQNDDLKRTLLETKRALLVEASPVDKIWGIGLPASHPDAQDPKKWRGQNLLGYCLTEVRERIKREESN